MKKNIEFKILVFTILLAMTAASVLAADSKHLIDSYWMADPLDPGHEPPAAGADPTSAVEGYWWRDAANQNVIAQHSEDENAGAVLNVIQAPNGATVLVYSSPSGPNVTAIMTSNALMIVGAGGSRQNAEAAHYAFQDYSDLYPTKKLEYLVFTDVSDETTWGGNRWRSHFRDSPRRMLASASYANAKQKLDEIKTETDARKAKALGQSLGWGADSFLGAGTMKEYNPSSADYYPPTLFISETTLLDLDGTPVIIFPTTAQEGGLYVYLPKEDVLITNDFGNYLPDVGSIYQPSVSVQDKISSLEQMMEMATGPIMYPWYFPGYTCDNPDPNINSPIYCEPGGQYYSSKPDYLIPPNGVYISGEDETQSALTTQRDALQSIYNQTITLINQGYTVDQAASAVALPADLAASSHTRELASTIPGVVKNIYHEKMGWFGGNTDELAGSLTSVARAEVMAELAGGASNLIEQAKTAELNARDLASAEKALYLAYAAYQAAPDDLEARRVYAQTLRKNAYMQKSAQVRNYFLTVALELGADQLITGFTKSGSENTPLAFTAADFKTNFNSVSGDLTKVKVISLPENGELGLNGAAVVAEQEIAVSILDGLIFTPTLNWNGQTSFTWNGSSTKGYLAEGASVTLDIAPVDNAPFVSAALADVAVDEDAAAISIDLSTIFSDIDIATNGDVLTYTTEISNPTLVSAAVDGANLTVNFLANQNGAASIKVTATDTAGEFVEDDFDVTVNPINDAPQANTQEVVVTADSARNFTLEYGDVETAVENLGFQLTSTSTHGALSGAAPTLTYMPEAGYLGDDSFSYTVSDRGDPDACTEAPCSGMLTSEATVTIHVVQTSLSGQVYNDANANGSLDEGEAGVAGATIQLIPADGSSPGETVTGADGSYTFGNVSPGAYQVHQVLLPGYVKTTADPIDINIEEGQAVGGINFGAVVSTDLQVNMTGKEIWKKIYYIITVTNNGPAEALDAALNDALPANVAYESAFTTAGACTRSGATVLCNFGALASGGRVTVILTAYRTNRNAVVNSATVTSSIFDINSANNTATVTIR